MQRRLALVLVLCALVLSPVAANADPVAARPGFRALSLADGPPVERFAGYDRYETAVAVSRAGWPEGSDYVFVATGGDFPDSTVAAPLAGAYDAPLLLTRSAGLPDAARAEIERLGATHAVIVGGTAAVSKAVARQIRGLGVADVTRIGGTDRYATAANVALHIAGRQETWGIVVATGTDHADCVTVSGLASALHTPLLLTRPDSLPGEAAAAIKRIDPAGTLIVGSEAAVSSDVESKLPRVRRVGGADRYATAVAVADLAEEAGFTPATLVVASGVAYADATVSGPLAASMRAPLLLVKPAAVPESIRAWVEARCSQVGRVCVVGGTDAVSESTVAALRAATVTRMNPRARVADTALASLVTTVAPDGSSITFSGWTDALRALVPGDILVFEASENVPEGFLGTVTRVEEVDGEVVVFAGEASLSDVFEKAGISYIVRSADETAPAASGAMVPAGFLGDAVDWIASAGSSLFDTFKDSGESMWDLVYLLATGDYEEGFSVDGEDVRWTSPEIRFDDKDDGTPVGSVVASLRDEPTVRFGVLIEDYSLEYCGLYAFDYPILTLAADIVDEGSARKRVHTRDLGTKEVKVGAIKVPFHNYLHADLGMDVRETQGVTGLKLGEAAAIVELESYVDGDGFHLGTARSGPDYFEIPSGDSAFLDPNARFEGDEDFDVWAGVRLESLAYNTAGPFVDARARLNTKVDSTASSADGAWRTVTAGLDADVGLHLKKIVDYEHTVTGIDLGSMVVHQDKGPFPAHVVDVARPAADNAIRVHLDGPGVLNASTVSASDFFSLPALTFVSAVPLGDDEFLLTCAQDLDRTTAYDVYLKPRSVANTNGLLNTVQSTAGFDCAKAPGVLGAYWVNHDTIEVDFGLAPEAPLPGPLVVTRGGVPVPVVSQSWVTDDLYGRRFLTVRLASPFGTEPLDGEYALAIPFGCVLDADGYYSFGVLEPVVGRWWAIGVESVRAVDYTHVDIAFRPDWTGTCDLLSADASGFAIAGESPVTVLGAEILPDGVTVRLTTSKMPYTTGPWTVSLASGAATDATLRSNLLVSEQFAPAPRATLVSVSAMDATHADLVFDGFGEISAASSAGIGIDGVASTEATVVASQTVRVTMPVQHLGQTYQVTVAEGAVSDAAGAENAPAAASLSAFPSPEMRQAWATNQRRVRLDYDVAPGDALDPATLNLSAFSLESDVALDPAEIVGATVDAGGRSVSIITSGTVSFTAYRVVSSSAAISDTQGRPCVAAEAAYEYSPPLIANAQALGPRSVWLSFELAPDRPVDPATVQASDLVVADAASGEEIAVAAASVVGGGRGVLLTLAEDASAGTAYSVSSAPDSFADSEGTWNRDTQAPFEGYDVTLTKRSMGVSPGHDVSRLVVDGGGVLWAEYPEDNSPGDTDALAWWRPSSAVPFGLLAGVGGVDPWYAYKLAALDGTRALVPGGGSEMYVWTQDGQVSGPTMLDMPPSQMPYPFSADDGTAVYGGMGGGVMAVDTDTWVSTWIPAGGMLCEWPTVSGDRVAWSVRNGFEREVWTADTASLEATMVAYADYDEPMASVSGTRIAYIRGGDVFVFDVTAGAETRITETPQIESAAVLSGNRVVFERREDAASDSSVWLTEVDSGFEKALSEGMVDARLPSVSGDTAAFVATGSRGAEVWLLDVGTP